MRLEEAKKIYEDKILKMKEIYFPGVVLHDPRLNDGEKLTLVLLAELCCLTAELTNVFSTKVHAEVISRVFNKSKRTALRTIKSLEEKGYILIYYHDVGEYFTGGREIFLSEKTLWNFYQINQKVELPNEQHYH